MRATPNSRCRPRSDSRPASAAPRGGCSRSRARRRTRACACFAEQLLDDLLGLLVLAFAKVVIPDPSLRVGDIDRGPVCVVERAPHRVVVVDRDRIVDPHLLRRAADVLDLVLDGELGRVHADHDEPSILVSRVPRAEVWERAQPVDAGEGPEVDQNHFAAKAGRRQRLGVEPSGRAVKRRQFPFDRQLRRGAHVLPRRAHHGEPGDSNEHRRSTQGAGKTAVCLVEHLPLLFRKIVSPRL